MAMPNFRLAQTQARWSLYISIITGLGLAVLLFLTFRGLDLESMNIWYSDTSKFGRLRKPLVFLGTAAVTLFGLTAAGMGYSSLGEKKNDKQSWSWMGLLGGAFFTTCSLICLMAWQSLSLTIIHAKGSP